MMTEVKALKKAVAEAEKKAAAEQALRVTPTMRLYLPRVEARLTGITALWCCRKKGHLHTIPCNEQEWDKELSYNRHFTQYINIIHTSSKIHTQTDYGQGPNENKTTPNARSPIVPTGLHY